MLRRLLHEPALLLTGRRRRLIIADLHLGILRFSDDSLVEKASSLAEMADEVILAGDVKHDIGMRSKEIKEVEKLIEGLKSAGLSSSDITVLKGNHDGGIDSVIKTEGTRGIRINDVGIFHGHAMPHDDVLQAKTLIFGHAHPAVLIRDEVGSFKERIWLEGKMSMDGKEKEIVVLPAFNEVCASTPVNLERPAGIFFRRWDYKKAEATLLDGTLLGKLEMLK
ncbi:MAG: metallophosphoesterase family protein [Archaeoglobaceae archaeon]